MIIAWLCVLAVASALTTPKEALRSVFERRLDGVLADPVTKEELSLQTRLVAGDASVRYQSSRGDYGVKLGTYVDLVSPLQALTLDDLGRALRGLVTRSADELIQTDTFRSPLTAFLYERGWRKNFERSGFPGIDAEFAEVREFFDLEEATAVLDLSCGTGLMTRRLVEAVPAGVRLFAGDYSEAMLLETRRRLGDESKPELLRLDVADLPFLDGSIDAIHAGAAMHCWPQLERALGEIHRVLKPEKGQFFATTFLRGALGTSRTERRSGFRFFTVDELDRLAREAGFEEVDVRREGSYCAVLKASTGGSAAAARGDETTMQIVPGAEEDEAPVLPESETLV